jgi:FkbM family methyltransferase
MKSRKNQLSIGPEDNQNRMHLISFAQNQEDIMLWRALRHVENGFYIDVGAADPVDLSVTRIFYDRGWRGINLEPNAVYFAALSKARPGEVNLPIGAGREAGQMTFHNVAGSGLSTFDSNVAAEHAANGWTVTERVVEVLPLAEICRRYRPQGPIHFLKIDVEGSEADVLAGADFDSFRPWIVLVEATLPSTQIESYVHWESLLTDHGYSFAWFDGLNRFYISDEMRPSLEPHFRVPPNVFDGFETSPSLFSRAEQAEQSQRETQQDVYRLHQELEARREQNADLSASLFSRAEQAEQSRRETLQDAHRLHQELEAMREQNADLSARLHETGATLAAMDGRLRDTQADLSAALGRASIAEMQVGLLLASTSWRISAPLRVIRRLLPGYAGSAESEPETPLGTPMSGKELARQVFHRSMRRLLALRGGRHMVRAARGIAPDAAEWLALRYRAYERRATHHALTEERLEIHSEPVELVEAALFVSPAELPDLSEEEVALFVPPAELPDLSEEEARLYRQLTINGQATSGSR